MIAESTTMIGEFETSLGVPTFAFFAHWSGEYSVDVDGEAGRLLAQMIVERMRRERSDDMALIVGARGGYPSFADIVLRTARQLDVKLQVLVPCRIDGAPGLIGVAADSVTLHPQGGIGALDSGLRVVPRRSLDAELLPYCPVEAGAIAAMDQNEEAMMGRLANDRLVRHEQQRMAAYLLESKGLDEDSVQSLLRNTLGSGLAVGVDKLTQLGVDARVAPVPLAEQMEALLDWARQTLHLFESPSERFEVSEELASEVEFEPATYVPTAALVGVDSVWLHELDTGSPDPDAPRLQGRWRRWDPEGDKDNQAAE